MSENLLNIERKFVPYKESFDLKELGYNEPCFGTHSDNSGGEVKFSPGMFQFPKKNSEANTREGAFIGEKGCYAPLWQDAFEWFRKKHGLIGKVDLELEYKGKINGVKSFERTGFWSYSITKLNEEYPEALGFNLKDEASYPEAELACLIKLIDIVKQNI